MTTLIIVLVVLGPGMYLWAPLLVRATLRYHRTPRFAPIGDTEDLPPDVRRHHDATHALLAPLGFREIGRFHFAAAAKTRSWVAILRDDERRAYALAACLEKAAGGQRRIVKTVEVVTRMRDAYCVSTTNSDSPMPAAPHRDRYTYTQLPGVINPSTVVAVHDRQVAAQRPLEPRPLEVPGREVEEIVAGIGEMTARYIEHGYLERERDTGECTLTWKGAYVWTWLQMWPVSVIAQSRMRATARRLLAELGLGPPASERTAA